LADVLALIQVLALDQHTQRSESGMKSELQGQPASASSWFEVAKDHREFFRVTAGHEHGLSLVARYVLPKTGEDRPLLASDLISALLETAINLHDRQMKDAERWKTYLPIWCAVIAGIFLMASTLIGHK
jgi:hypothetical protein